MEFSTIVGWVGMAIGMIAVAFIVYTTAFRKHA